MSNELQLFTAAASKKATDLYYGLRLNRLNPQQRKLQKGEIVDGDGYLTALGIRVYLDYLWQKDTDGQKVIADEVGKELKTMKKDKNKDED